MNTPTSPLQTSTDQLVEAIATRLRRLDLISWAQITKRAEELGLSFEDLRLLLALMTSDGPCSVSDLASLSGLSLETAYPATHGLRRRGFLTEERRRYSLRKEGRELIASLDAAHREGIRAYVDELDAGERKWLEELVDMTPPERR